MPKPKAPVWLRESFRDGVDELYMLRSAYPGADIFCWLAQHDREKRPCSGRLERFHFIGRQRLENALGALLPGPNSISDQGDVFAEAVRKALILLAAWDPRNGGISCVGHHRRYDNHATPSLPIPYTALPGHVVEFVYDWGLETEAERRFVA